MLAGWGLFGVVISLLIVEITLNRFIKKVTNCYFFWLSISLFCLVWLIVFRFKDDWSVFWEKIINHQLLHPEIDGESNIISSALLMDICPFSAITLLLACIFDPSRKVARAIAPAAIMGGIITFCFVSHGDAEWSLRYIFIGSDNNKVFFFMHSMQILLGFGILLNTPKNRSKGILASYYFLCFFMSYVLILRLITGCAWHCSGLCSNDFLPSGALHKFQEILKVPVKLCPLVTPFILSFAVTIPLLIKEFVFGKFEWWYYGSKKNSEIVVFKNGKRIRKWWFWYDYKNDSLYQTIFKKNQEKEYKRWISKNK